MVLLFCFRSGKYILELSGVAPLLIIIIGAALRCFVPIDIPVFTRVIQHEGWLAKLDAGLRTPIIYGHITPLAIIWGVWIIGTLIASFTTIWSYRTHMDKVRAYLPSENPAILSAAEAAARKLQLPVPTVCPISKGKSPSISRIKASGHSHSGKRLQRRRLQICFLSRVDALERARHVDQIACLCT